MKRCRKGWKKVEGGEERWKRVEEEKEKKVKR